MSDKRTWPRRLAIAVVATLALGLLLATLAFWALRAPRAQQAVLARLSRWTEAELGFAVAADGFRLGPLQGSLEVDRVRLQVPGAPPFASARRLSARWAPGAIFRRPLRLTSIAVEGPTVDLGAPLPAGRPDAQAAPAAAALPLAVDRLLISDGTVAGDAAGELVSGWRLEELGVDGGFDGRRLIVDRLTTAARLALADRAGEPVPLAIALAGAAELDGTLEVGSLKITGEGLDAAASGRLGPAGEAVRAAFTIAADPGFWLRGEPTGRVDVVGDVDLGAWRGTVTLDGGRQPATLLAGFLPADQAPALELAGSSLELAADLSLEAERSLAGTVRLGVFRERTQILDLVASPRLTIGSDLLAEISAEARILPGDPGERHLAVRLGSPRAGSLGDWQIAEGEAKLDQPAVDELARRLAGLYPRLLDPAAIPQLPPLGRLVGRGRFQGPLADPKFAAEAELRPHPGGRVALVLSGRAIAGPLLLETTGSGLDVGHFTPHAAGRLDWRGSARDPFGAVTGSLELALQDLATAGEPIVESLTATIAGDRQRLGWRFEARGPNGVSGTGAGTVEPVLPLRRATAQLMLETGDGRLPRVEGSLALADGALAAGLRAAVAGREPVALELAVPLAALDALPRLAALARLPLARRGGAIEVGWSAPDGDWTALLPEGPSGRITRLEGGSSGRASLDLECPACSTGSAELRGFAMELDGRHAAATGDLRLTLAAGRLRVEPWSLAGDGVELDAEGDFELSPSWRPGDEPTDLLTRVGAVLAASVDSAWLTSLPIEIQTPGIVSLRAELTGAPARLVGTAEVAAPGLAVVSTAYPTLALTEPAAHLSLADGFLDWQGARLRVGDAIVTSGGRARLAAPLSEATGWLEVVSGLPVIDSLRLPFALRAGVLEVADGTIATTAGAGSLQFAVPVDGRAEGPVRIAWELPANDWAPLLARLGAGQDPEVLELATRGSLALSPDRPALADGSILLEAVRLVMRGRETRFEPSIDISVADGELRIAPVVLRSATETFSFQARGALAPGWRSTDPPASLLADFEILGSGDIDAGLLNPFLAGGRATGALGLEIAVRGSPASYTGEIRVAGPEAAVLYRTPYLTRLERPELQLTLIDGAIELTEGSARLNEGALRLSGTAWQEGRSDLQIELSEALFRLDYGLLANLGADLSFQLTADGSSKLTGTLDLDRGALTRAVRLDLDFLSQLLAPIDLTTTEDDPLDLVTLDVSVRTREGVRVKNNLGDLLVRWEPLTVTGTLAQPVIEGRLEADPGGLLYLYGQTVRLDKAVIEYPGQEGAEPQLDFEVTTSLEDPSIGRLAGADPFRDSSGSEPGTAPVASAAAADLARYVGEQFAGKVGDTAGLTVSLRPLLIFGETDPGAQLTVGRDISPTLAIAAAVDLRNAQGRTYLLELHELRQLPRLVAQAYTNDQSDFGGALLQRQQFGGTKKAAGRDLPRISKIVVKPPPGVSRRAVKRALGLDKGDPFDPRQRFAAEVELVDYLLAKGYPDASVTVRSTVSGRRGHKVALEVDVAPGPHVRFVFAGEKIPKPLRPLITEIYRPDVFEPESIEELAAETVRALRSRGFLQPTVEVRVEPLDVAQPDGARRVVIRTEGGVKISPEPPVFLGVPSDDAAELGALFVNAVQRIELAVGLSSADRRLLAALEGLGYPEARIARRYESLGERVLTVEIEPGSRQRIASVAIDSAEGAADISGEGLETLLEVAAGDALRRSRLSRSALAIQRELNARGRLEAGVRTLVAPADDSDPYEVAVRFVVDPGPVSQLAEIQFRGLRSTHERWARRVTDLDSGQILARGDLAKARTELWRTGLFSGVTTETFDVEPGAKGVVFDLTESDRYQLSYGVRWDSEQGPGAVFDATDHNFLGRNWTLGLRALSSSEESSLRGLTRIPRIFGGPGSFDIFAAAREVTETAIDIIFGPTEIVAEILEGTLQYSHPLGTRTTARVYGRYTDTRRAFPFFTLRVKNPQLGLQYVFDSRSPEPLTQRGALASVDLSGSGSFLGGDLRYARMFAQLNLHRPAGRLLGRGLTWSQSYRLGLAEAFDQELVRDVRFFAGGEYSVRGYATDSLGEQSAFDMVVEPTGGAALLVLNQEIGWRLFNDYALVLFVDAGNVWQDTGELGRNLLKSTGIGLRALTPIGLLRLDVAHALDRRPEIDPEFGIYFGLGTSF